MLGFQTSFQDPSSLILLEGGSSIIHIEWIISNDRSFLRVWEVILDQSYIPLHKRLICISAGKGIAFGQSWGSLGVKSPVPRESGSFLRNVFSFHHLEPTHWSSSEFEQGQNPSLELEFDILSLLQL